MMIWIMTKPGAFADDEETPIVRLAWTEILADDQFLRLDRPIHTLRFEPFLVLGKCT